MDSSDSDDDVIVSSFILRPFHNTNNLKQLLYTLFTFLLFTIYTMQTININNN